MGRISLRMPDILEQEAKDLIVTSEYPNISELIRELLRKWVAERRYLERTVPKKVVA